MKIAALTYAYNEAVNLPIWVNYYGRNFGAEHLYVLDHGSDDASTSNLGAVSVIHLPRSAFDDVRKSATVSAFHTLLLQHYDCIVATDCDEIIVADPDKYESLDQYIRKTSPVVTAGIGLQIHQLLDQEGPIDLKKPILSQRRVGYFGVPSSKPLISSVPTRWAAGGHACSVRARIDPELFIFHTKFMDFYVASDRHALNSGIAWSKSQEASGHGVHHRYSRRRFVHEGFMVPMDVFNNGRVQPFQFEKEIAAMEAGVQESDGLLVFGHADAKFVQIPERFAESF